jgi:hypothetical protein
VLCFFGSYTLLPAFIAPRPSAFGRSKAQAFITGKGSMVVMVARQEALGKIGGDLPCLLARLFQRSRFILHSTIPLYKIHHLLVVRIPAEFIAHGLVLLSLQRST